MWLGPTEGHTNGRTDGSQVIAVTLCLHFAVRVNDDFLPRPPEAPGIGKGQRSQGHAHLSSCLGEVKHGPARQRLKVCRECFDLALMWAITSPVLGAISSR